MDNYIIREMKKEDWESIKEIYSQALLEGKSTFNKDLPTYQEWDKNHLQDCRYVVERNESIIAWCSLAATSSREVYRGVVEVSIYVHQQYRGKGVGKKLLTHLCIESEKKGYWTLYSGILANNIESRKLHLNCGFREIGYREKIAKDIFGEWQDTVIYEKRSKIIF
ncbi:GNAT family N-acetyltransferase [uncultured Fusobacterium sp.]|uniref:GNAT family N-acetyltransferase n=1 Tax=uncultured Fusobacterium sp. TaxID=159267 RepID=UPI0026013872|nr:GNAT family N-acetyltransferase [uncultured Fusobacterium sp.]